MSDSQSASNVAVRRKAETAKKPKNGVRRKSPLRRVSPKKKKKTSANGLTPRGYFGGQEVMDATNGAYSTLPAERQHFTPEELKAFFKYIPVTSFWHSYFYIQYFYGCRLSEPALILDEDISLNRRHEQIIIRRLKKAREEGGFREHVYDLDPRVVEAVKFAQAYKEAKKMLDNPFLFASNRKRESVEVGAERLSQLRNIDGWQAVSRFTAHRMFCKVAKAVRIQESLRQSVVLRHTRAIVLLSSGESPEKTMNMLGHSSMNMTMRYANIAEILRDKYAVSVVGREFAP